MTSVKKETREQSSGNPYRLPEKFREAMAVKVAMGMQLPLEAVAGLPRMELTGNRELSLEGIRSVEMYTETRLCLNCGRVTVTIEGDSLCMERYVGQSAVITGIFTSLGFC